MNLYTIAQEYRELASKLADADLDEQTKLDTLESISGDLETKVQNVACVIRQLEAEAASAKAEADRITKLAKSRANAATQLEQWLTIGLQASGKTELAFPAFTVKLKNNPPSVVVNNEELIPDEYIRTKVVTEPDKVKIKEALKSGEAVPGCHLESKQTVVIK